jgi:RNA polymerase sigma factor (TIGR02999 family)
LQLASASMSRLRGAAMPDLRMYAAALYAELRRLARREVRRLGAQDVVGGDSLVHEAWLAMDRGRRQPFDNEGQFLAYARRTMHNLVVDLVRARHARKRGSGVPGLELDTDFAALPAGPEPAQAVEAALADLAAHEPALAQLVELKCLCGLTLVEVARAQGISERTAQRRWKQALDHLQRRLA